MVLGSSPARLIESHEDRGDGTRPSYIIATNSLNDEKRTRGYIHVLNAHAQENEGTLLFLSLVPYIYAVSPVIIPYLFLSFIWGVSSQHHVTSRGGRVTDETLIVTRGSELGSTF